MSKDKLELNTKKSLYEPIEIKIDDQVYHSVKTTRAILKEVNKLDDEILKDPENDELLYKVIQLLYDIESEILDKLDKREVQDIYTFSKQKFMEIEKQRVEIITSTFGKIWTPDKQKTAESTPSLTRPGSKL